MAFKFLAKKKPEIFQEDHAEQPTVELPPDAGMRLGSSDKGPPGIFDPDAPGATLEERQSATKRAAGRAGRMESQAATAVREAMDYGLAYDRPKSAKDDSDFELLRMEVEKGKSNPLQLASSFQEMAERRSVSPALRNKLVTAASLLREIPGRQREAAEIESLNLRESGRKNLWPQLGEETPAQIQEETQNLKTTLGTLQEELEKKKSEREGASIFKRGQLDKDIAGLESRASNIERSVQAGEERLRSPQTGGGTVIPFQTREAARWIPGENAFVQGGPMRDETISPTDTPIQDYLKSLGVKREQLVDNARKVFQAAGIPPDEWNDLVATQPGIMRIWSTLDPKQEHARKFQMELQAMAQEDSGPFQQLARDSKERSETLRAEQTSKVQEFRRLAQVAGTNPILKTWYGIILFVITAITAGTKNAIALFAATSKYRNAPNEMKFLEEELRALDRKIASEDEWNREMKREAARQILRKSELEDRQVHDFGLQMMRAKAKAKEAERRAEGTEEKEAIGSLRRDLSMFQGQADEAQKSLEMLSNATLLDPFGFGRGPEAEAKKQEFRKHQLQNLRYYRNRAQAVAQVIEELTGTRELLTPSPTPQPKENE